MSNIEKSANPKDEFTFVNGDMSPLKRAAVKLVEWKFSEQIRSIREGFAKKTEGTGNKTPWTTMAEVMGLNPVVNQEDIKKIPQNGPLIIVSNHPLGVPDGVLAGAIMEQTRKDVRVTAHGRYKFLPEIESQIMPVSFDNSCISKEEFQGRMAKARSNILDFLGNDGCLVTFPAGHVSTTPKWHSEKAVDSPWHSYIGGLVIKTGANVVPISINDQNSRLFQMASHFSFAARQAMYIPEAFKASGKDISISVGEPISNEEMTGSNEEYAKKKEEIAKFLQNKSQSLSM